MCTDIIFPFSILHIPQYHFCISHLCSVREPPRRGKSRREVQKPLISLTLALISLAVLVSTAIRFKIVFQFVAAAEAAATVFAASVVYYLIAFIDKHDDEAKPCSFFWSFVLKNHGVICIQPSIYMSPIAVLLQPASFVYWQEMGCGMC